MRIRRSRCCIRGAAPGIYSVLPLIYRHPTAPKTPLPRACVRKRIPRAGRTMLDSVRSRLTLWYTAVLALVLVILSLITYFIFWRSTVRRTDANLAELSEAFLVTLRAEMEDQRGPDAFKLAAQVAINEHL